MTDEISEQIINLWEAHGLPPCNTYSQVLFARSVLALGNRATEPAASEPKESE